MFFGVDLWVTELNKAIIWQWVWNYPLEPLRLTSRHTLRTMIPPSSTFTNSQYFLRDNSTVKSPPHDWLTVDRPSCVHTPVYNSCEFFVVVAMSVWCPEHLILQPSSVSYSSAILLPLLCRNLGGSSIGPLFVLNTQQSMDSQHFKQPWVAAFTALYCKGKLISFLLRLRTARNINKAAWCCVNSSK